jgi:alkylation response protein AidB-like acyl-CoA dehydrogenase
MDLSFSPEEERFREKVQKFLRENLPSGWAQAGAGSRPAGMSVTAFLKDWQRRLFENGFLGMAWPKEFGGQGASQVEMAIFNEEVARCRAPGALNVLGLTMAGPTIITHGTDEQKQRYLSKILSCEEIWCQGFSEPNSGSDMAAARTRAELQGDEFVVSGQKVWTTLAHIADWCMLLVRTDSDAPKHRGLSYLLVDMHSPGVTVKPLRQMTGESEFNELFFRDVRVPAENVLGKVNDGWNVAMSTLMYERGSYGARLHLIFKRYITRLIELARNIKRNGRPAAEDPIIRQKLAQCSAEIEIMRFNQMRAFSRLTATGVPGPEGSIQKIFWSELNQRLQQIAQEILGPYGQLLGGDPRAIDNGMWSYAYLRTRGNTIEAGTSEVQRNIIGHFVLGLPRSD